MGASERALEGCSAEEWAARVELAACYRIFAHLGWGELIYNHISLRLPGPETHFLINPFGLTYREVTASNLVKIDLEGRIVGAWDWPVNLAGFTVHAAIHAAMPDAHCVMHTHTTAGLAVASLEEGLSPTNFYSAQLYGKVAYHPFEGITIHPEEGARLVANIGDKPAVILRNHGLLAWAPSVPQAFATLWLLNRACEIQMATLAMGPARPITEQALLASARDSMTLDPQYGAGRDVFDALTREIERLDPSYKS